MRWPAVRTLQMLVLICLCGGFAASAFAQRARRERSEPLPPAQRPPISLDGGASINPEVIQDVEDDTLGLTFEDREAYFRILKLTEKLDPADLAEFAREFREDRHAASERYRHRPLRTFPTFVDLFRHPEEYRGRPVTLHGYFRRLATYPAGENEQDFDDLFEGWLYTDDSQGNPAVVIFTDKPEGLPIGGDITEEVIVTGYFLKMYGYAAQDTNRKAPLILAHSVRWRPQRASAAGNLSPQTYIGLSLAALAIGLMIFFVVRESQLRAAAEKQARWAKFEQFVPPSDAAASSATPHRNGSHTEPHH